MKIMLVGSDAGISGAGFSMIKLAEELENMGISVIRVVRKGNTWRILNKQGIKCYIVNAQSWVLTIGTSGIKKWLKVLIKKLINLRCYYQYCKIIKKEKPDIVHINAITTYVAAKAAIKFNIPIVWHIREFLEEDLGGEFWNKKQALGLLSKASYLIAISDGVKEKYQNLLPNNNVIRIYNGIDMDVYYLPKHEIFTDKNIYITMAGRITENKGQYDALVALKDILKENPNIILRFAGEGTEKETAKLKRYIVENNINSYQVILMGYVSDMSSLWEKTDITIVYSKHEAFGRVTVEAMAAGVLVLGIDAGANKELINHGENGFLFGHGEGNSLDNLIRYVIKNRDQVKCIAAKAREEVRVLYTSQNNAQEVEKVYMAIEN